VVLFAEGEKDASLTTAPRQHTTEEKKAKEGGGLTPNAASQRLRKGSRTVALICPQADTMRLTAARMVGDVEIRFSADHSGLGLGGEGKSREGKSSVCFFDGVVEGVEGVEGGDVRGVGVWKWTWERL
jgi:hypothetical protein